MDDIKRREFLAAAAATALSSCAGVESMPLVSKPKPSMFVPKDLPAIKDLAYTQQPSASPIHLSSSFVLNYGSSGAVPSAALKNPMGQDMELLEIKFEISGPSVTGTPIGQLNVKAPIFGGTVWCELTMGSLKLTNGAIPVWCFGRAENLSSEALVGNGNTYASYSWRLPRPLFVPAGAVVAANFTHTGFVSNALNVRIGYSARTVFVKPKKFYVPWVSKYASKVFNPLSTAGVDVSSEIDLVNPHPEPVYLQRFVGRTLVSKAGGEADEDAPVSFGSRALQLRMADSYGRPIVRSYTPFRVVFGALTRSWELENGAQMDPEAYYIVNLRKDAMSFAASPAGESTLVGASGMAFVSAVGWRELESL